MNENFLLIFLVAKFLKISKISLYEN